MPAARPARFDAFPWVVVDAVDESSVADATLRKPFVFVAQDCFATVPLSDPSDVPVAPVRTSQPAGSAAVPVPSKSNVWT